MRILLILLLLSTNAYAATVSVTVDNTKAAEYVDHYSGDASMTTQEKLDWLRDHILSYLRDNFQAMRIIKARETNQSNYSTESATAFSN